MRSCRSAEDGRLPPGPLTYEDYVELPDDGRRYEILDGELYVCPAPVPRHQRVSANLQYHLTRHVREHQTGEVLAAPIDLILASTTVAQPDLVFIRKGLRPGGKRFSSCGKIATFAVFENSILFVRTVWLRRRGRSVLRARVLMVVIARTGGNGIKAARA